MMIVVQKCKSQLKILQQQILAGKSIMGQVHILYRKYEIIQSCLGKSTAIKQQSTKMYALQPMKTQVK